MHTCQFAVLHCMYVTQIRKKLLTYNHGIKLFHLEASSRGHVESKYMSSQYTFYRVFWRLHEYSHCWNDENLCETSMHHHLRPSYETFTWPGTPVAKEFPPTKIGAPTPKLSSRARPQKRQADKCVDLGRSSEDHFPAIFICISIIINQSLSSIKSSSTSILSMLVFPKKCLKILQQMIDDMIFHPTNGIFVKRVSPFVVAQLGSRGV